MHSGVKDVLRRLGFNYSDHVPFLFSSVHEYQRDEQTALRVIDRSLLFRLTDVFLRTYDLGCTAFGGPPVHFRIFYQRFVQGDNGYAPWFDEQSYQELFGVSQALPGPASTKMIFMMVFVHSGLVCSIAAFFIWSLPGAVAMYLLSLGVGKIGEALPGPVYGLLSGLNASTVGIIALAAVQLASKAITDPLTRIIVIGGACAGLCYTALWYFPALVVMGGLITVVWDIWLSRVIGKLKAKRDRKRVNRQRAVEESQDQSGIPLEDISPAEGPSQRRTNVTTNETKDQASTMEATERPAVEVSRAEKSYVFPIWTGVAVMVGFFVSFAAVLTTRGVLKAPPLALDLFSNMYLAGTIIFGGGPVVIPLLREYTVQPGWVSSRDFLIGLGIIQALPGPNFNFAVYLGALTLRGTDTPTFIGAMIAFLGIFVPGLSLAVGVQSIWRVLRTKPLVVSCLRGINAAAVGLVFTAVYRLWEIGYLTPDSGRGKSLAGDPWWVVVAAITYSGSAWFKVPPAVAIVMGAVLGLCWYGVAGHRLLGS